MSNIFFALAMVAAAPAPVTLSPDCDNRVLIKNITINQDSAIQVPDYEHFPCLQNVQVRSLYSFPVDPPMPHSRTHYYEPLTWDKIKELRAKGIIINSCFEKECQ